MPTRAKVREIISQSPIKSSTWLKTLAIFGTIAFAGNSSVASIMPFTNTDVLQSGGLDWLRLRLVLDAERSGMTPNNITDYYLGFRVATVVELNGLTGTSSYSNISQYNNSPPTEYLQCQIQCGDSQYAGATALSAAGGYSVAEFRTDYNCDFAKNGERCFNGNYLWYWYTSYSPANNDSTAPWGGRSSYPLALVAESGSYNFPTPMPLPNGWWLLISGVFGITALRQPRKLVANA